MRTMAIFLLFVLSIPFALAKTIDHEQRLLDHAWYCLVNDIVLSSLRPEASPSNDVSCRAGELGLAFIGEKTSKKANVKLAKLRRYVLDGVLGESYDCYILSKGDRVLSAIKRMDFAGERKTCEVDTAQRIKELGIAEKDINLDAICADPVNVQSWIKGISVPVKSGRKCNMQDW